jgi:putative metallohydrolase (TIGR04338 family)
MADPDRGAVYSAEFILRDQLTCSTVNVHGATVVIPVERKFAELVDVQRYADAVLALNWVRATYPAAAEPVTVKRGRAINTAKCGGGVMTVNPDHTRWALRETVVLHELAHHLTPHATAHGAEFRAAFLHLLEELVAPEAAWLLRVGYTDAGLTTVYTPVKM